jgi:hypothetical protein
MKPMPASPTMLARLVPRWSRLNSSWHARIAQTASWSVPEETAARTGIPKAA